MPNQKRLRHYSRVVVFISWKTIEKFPCMWTCSNYDNSEHWRHKNRIFTKIAFYSLLCQRRGRQNNTVPTSGFYSAFTAPEMICEILFSISWSNILLFQWGIVIKVIWNFITNLSNACCFYLFFHNNWLLID